MKQFKSLSDYGNVENQRFTTFHTIRLLLPLTFDAILTDQFTHNLGLDNIIVLAKYIFMCYNVSEIDCFVINIIIKTEVHLNGKFKQ